MGQVRDTAESLYQSGALLGFAIASREGEMIYNESFFSDETALNAIGTLSGCVSQLGESGRNVQRLTVELDDVIVIYGYVADRDRQGLFILSRDCDLDYAANALAALAAA